MPPSLLLPRWRRLGRGPTVFVVGPACHGPLLYNRARAQAGIRPSDTALIQKICPSRPCSRQISASLHVCAKTIPRRTREDQIDKDFRPILLDFILKTNKVKPGRLEYNRWITAPPTPYWLPNTSALWMHLLILDGQFSENRKAVKAAQLTPGVGAQRESLLASQAYLLFTHPSQSVGDSPLFSQLVLLNIARSAIQTNSLVKSVGLISSTLIKCH